MKFFSLLIAVCFYFYFTNNILGFVQVKGDSMNGVLYDNAVCVLDCRYTEFERFDIVVVKLNNSVAIKRIIGIPNDKILIKNGIVYVNGKECSEYDYYTEHEGIAKAEITLGKNEYFLLGDNRENSYDSRDYGLVSAENIKGKITKILWKGGK